MSRIFFHVQYLKGLGHLQRARLIAEAACAKGHRVHMVSGGLAVDSFNPQGAELHQLPALQAGPGGFKDLRDSDGAAVDADWLARRRDKLLDLFRAVQPDILLVESYPFGRRQFAFELEPLLEAARAAAPSPAVICSIRDILQVKKRPQRNLDTVSTLRRFFDAVLIHGEPSLATLDETFSEAASIEDMIHYTGIVAPSASAFVPLHDTPKGEVIVSMGGGAIGPTLLKAALDARPKTVLADQTWRILTGPHLPETEFNSIRSAAPAGVVVERFRDDFQRLLAAARLSVSYAGYNTCADVLRARVPAVLISYSGDGGETEQITRARRFSALGLASAVPDTRLTGDLLAAAIDDACRRSIPGDPGFELEGAARSAELLTALAPAQSM